jgi:hypothetical protein
MSNYKELDDALSLIKTRCTVEQIQDLLRTRKGQENVRITAETKDEVVDRNLRGAVEAKAIEIESIFDLIRSSEENGNQHIFYFKPKSKAIADVMIFESVAQQLWRANWKQTVEDFPAIRLKPNDYQYSDFRPHPTKPKDWILKVYGHTTITRFTGKTEVREGSIWKEFVEEQLRIVLLARWNNLGLLEIRVQRNESRRRVDEWHNKVWEMLKPALVRTQFDPWELSKPMGQLIEKQGGNNTVYNFRDARVIDEAGGVNVNFQTISEQGNLFTSTQTRDSLQSYLDAKSVCNGLSVTWMKQASGKPQKELRTLLAAKERNEMVVVAHCSGEDLDYVTEQLRRFNK